MVLLFIFQFQPDIPGAQQVEDDPKTYQTNPYKALDNAMLMSRHLICSESKPFELYWPLELIDVFNFKDKTRALPSNVELELSFLEGDSAIVLSSNGGQNAKYKLEILEMELDVCLLKLAPAALSSYELSLRRAPFEAHLEYWNTELSYVSHREIRSSRIFTGELPPFFHVVFMSQRQYHGHFECNPHYFYHYNVAELIVDFMDGKDPLTIHYDWSRKLPDRAFFMHCHFEPGIPLLGQVPANGFLNPDSFKSG